MGGNYLLYLLKRILATANLDFQMQPEMRDDGSKQARSTMDRIGRELLESSKKNLQTSGKVEKSTLKGRDILTLLLRANMATDIPEHQRMRDGEVLARTSSLR